MKQQTAAPLRFSPGSTRARQHEPGRATGVWPVSMRLLLSSFIILAAVISGAFVGAFSGLFTYAGSTDPTAYDARFLVIFTLGIAVGVVIGYSLARRAMRELNADDLRPGVVLLRKYQHLADRAAGTSDAGEYRIDSVYVRDLLGPR